MNLRRLLIVLVCLPLALTGLTLATTAPAHAGPTPWPMPLDWMPEPGEEKWAHEEGGAWTGQDDPPYSGWNMASGLAYPSAADLVPEGTDVRPVGWCAQTAPRGPEMPPGYSYIPEGAQLLRMTVVPEVVTVGEAGAVVEVSCIYQTWHPPGVEPVDHAYGGRYRIRAVPAARPAQLEVSGLDDEGRLELDAGETGVVQARLTASGGNRVPTGLVQVEDATGQVLGADTVVTGDGGRARIGLPALPAGRHDLTVTYGGNPAFGPTSVPLVVRARRDAELLADPDPVVNRPGEPIAFTVHVRPVGGEAGTVGGTVGVREDDLSLGEFPVVAGRADVDLGVMPFPDHTLTLRYTGDDGTRPTATTVRTSGPAWITHTWAEEQRYGQDGWSDGETGTDDEGERTWTTVDGNPTRLRWGLVNPLDEAATVTVRVLGPDGTEVTGSEETVELAPHEETSGTEVVDTTGDAWLPSGDPAVLPRLYRVEAEMPDGTTVTEPLRLVARPLPVVLVHGWNSSAAGWGAGPGTGYDAMLQEAHPGLRGYAVGDGQVPGRMDTGNLESPAWTNTIAQNAQQEALYVEGVRRLTGAQHVDLVVHSMGGLISRYYVQELMPEQVGGRPVVRHLVQLGTPNMGSPCADRLMEATVLRGVPLLFPQPSTLQLTTHHAELFNASTTHLRGVPISNLVGTDIPLPCGYPEDSDVVVPVWSARWTLPAADRPEAPVIHTDMTAHAGLLRDYVVPRLAALPGTTAARTSPAPTAAAVPGPGRSAATVAAPVLEVPAEGWGEARVDVPDGELLGVTAVGAGVQVQLLDPAGEVVALGEPPAGGLPMAGLLADHTGAGAWTVRARAVDGGAARQVPVSVWVEGSALTLAIDRAERVAGELALTATLADGGQPLPAAVPAELTAHLLDVTGTGPALTLLDDGRSGDGVAGDGVYGYRGPARSAGPVASEEEAASVVVVARTGRGSRVASAPVLPGSTDPVDPDPVDPDPVDPDPVDPDPVPAPVILTQPGGTTTTVGGIARFAVTVEGETTGYRWQARSPGSEDWTLVAGTDGPLLTVHPTSRTEHGTAYRVVVTGPGGTVTSDAATLRVDRGAAVLRARARATRSGGVRWGAVVEAPEGLASPSGTLVVRRGGRVVARVPVVAGRASGRLPRSRPTVLVLRFRGNTDLTATTVRVRVRR